MKNLINMNARFVLAFFITVFSGCVAIAQGDTRSAPVVDPFSLSSDNVGAIANSVNLFTGDLTMPLNLVSLPGRSGGINVSISYSSGNIETIADTWNLDHPTGILGLGWSMPLMQITVDNKQTAARDDDDFYLQDGHTSTLLVCMGINGGVRNYVTKSFSNRKITYTSAQERWDVIMDDGSKMVFGDATNFPTSVQWINTWNNWIGDSGIGGTGNQGVVWNLSSVTNLWGDQIKYTYLKVENTVGNTGTVFPQTEASYLSTIIDSEGHEVDFVYRNKTPQEIMEPHTEQPEPDSYQERYERLFLDRLYVKGDGVTAYEIDFRYGFNSPAFIANGNNTKRLLKSITKVSASGNLQNAIVGLSYLTSGPMKDALTSVTTPFGGSVNFQYSATAVNITHSPPHITLTAPSGYGEPQIAIANDYSVVTWRQMNGASHDAGPRPLLVYANSWEGEWKSTALTIPVAYYSMVTRTGSASGPQDFKIAVEDDFFAILLRDYSVPSSKLFRLFIWKKDENTAGNWIFFTQQLNFGNSADETKKKLYVKNKFVAVSNEYGTLFRYIWNGVDWTPSIVSDTPGTRFTAAADNYIISHDPSPVTDDIKFYYLDEQKEWSAPKQIYTTINNGSGDPVWVAASTYAFVMPSGSLQSAVIYWDNTYSYFSYIPKYFNYSAQTPSYYSSESLLAFEQFVITPPNTSARALRFNGSDWVDTGELWGGNMAAFGEDFYLGHASAKYVVFEPNTGVGGTWSSPSSGLGGTGASTSIVGVGYSIMNAKFNFKLPNGTWTGQALTGNMDGAGGTFGAPGFFLSGSGGLYSKLFYIKDGQFVSTGIDLYSRYSANAYSVGTQFFVGSKSFALYPAGSTYDGATTVTLVRVDPKGLNATSIPDYPVTLVTQSDGIKPTYTSFVYDPLYVITDISRGYAQYNKVFTIKGVQSTSIYNAPNGYTTTWFFNGLPESEVSDTYPSSYTGQSIWAANSNYKKLTGQQYRTYSSRDYYGSYGSDILNENSYQVVGLFQSGQSFNQYPIWNGAGHRIGNAFQSQLASTSSTQYTPTSIGYSVIKSVNYKTFNQYGYPDQSVESTIPGGSGTATATVQNSYLYASNFYSQAVTLNILSPVLQTIKLVNGVQTESVVNRWKTDWPCTGPNCLYSSIPAAYDTYSWKGTNSPGFLWPDVASQTPSSDWYFEGLINSRDSYNGVETETKGTGGQVTSQLWDNNRRSVIASGINVPASKIAYCSFEDAAKGNWAWGGDCIIATGVSKTGNNSINVGATGISKSGLATADTYVVSFWALTSGGSLNISGVSGAVALGTLSDWTAFQFTVTNLSSLTISLNGATPVKIDELRIVPTYGKMITSTFHPIFGQTSSSDNNNMPVIYKYDELGRLVNTVDEKGNILSNVIYNLKK